MSTDYDKELQDLEGMLRELNPAPKVLVIDGIKEQSTRSSFHQEGDRITIIRGIPPCPMCSTLLTMRPMPGLGESYWYCRECGTEWDTGDLIQVLNDNQELARRRDDNTSSQV